MDDLGPERLSFLDRPLPAWVELKIVVVAAGQRLAYDQADWCDAVVVVEGGELELEWLGGGRRRFGRGPPQPRVGAGRPHRRGTTPAPMSLGPAGRLNGDGSLTNEESNR